MSIKNSVGYIICESDIEPKITNIRSDRDKSGKAIGEGILQTAEEKNRNGRIYTKPELFPQIEAPRTIELLNAGYLRAELGHPLSKDLARQSVIDDTKTCARFLKLWTEGNNVWGWFKGTNNEYGNAFDLDLKDGCKPAWSLRALGSVFKTNRGMEVRNLRLITWDQVIYPSHPGAYTQRLVSEMTTINEASSLVIDESEKNDPYGTERMIPINNESVINYLQASSNNLKFVKECCDFMYKDIIVNEAGTKVGLTLKETGETMIVNIESYIHDELMRYSTEEY